MCTKTYFAPCYRTDSIKLNDEIQIVSKNPIIEALLYSVSGIIAVLDENRQIVSVNDNFLKIIGVKSFEEIAGLRPGEALDCKYNKEMPGGCGTSRHCSTCGAAIAITASLAQNDIQERICVLKKNGDKDGEEICLLVRCSPIIIDGSRFLLMFIQDITKNYVSSYIERIFFHDINNIITGLFAASELLEFTPKDTGLVKNISNLAQRLKNEVETQRVISKTISETYKLNIKKVTVNSIFNDLESLFKNNPMSKQKFFDCKKLKNDITFFTDSVILFRILENMLINAFEASEKGDRVILWTKKDKNELKFYVWNKKPIPENIQLRIFQRFFSTKKGDGRGLGTFSMKLLGEKFLKGQVDFKSTGKDGTIFKLAVKI